MCTHADEGPQPAQAEPHTRTKADFTDSPLSDPAVTVRYVFACGVTAEAYSLDGAEFLAGVVRRELGRREHERAELGRRAMPPGAHIHGPDMWRRDCPACNR